MICCLLIHFYLYKSKAALEKEEKYIIEEVLFDNCQFLSNLNSQIHCTFQIF